MNRLVETIDSLENSTKYRYDPVGNRSRTRDQRGTEWNYQYYDNNLLKRAEATGADGTTYWAEYTYDQAGNRQTVKDDSVNEIKYNFEGDIYQPDPLNRINNINRSFDGASYGTAYRYNPAGLVTGIKYPEAAGWVDYQYNDLNQLAEVTGFNTPQGISYHDDGALKGINYANGAKAVYNYDTNRRLDDMKVIVGA
jgi:YD repeat-containing protein